MDSEYDLLSDAPHDIGFGLLLVKLGIIFAEEEGNSIILKGSLPHREELGVTEF